MQVFAVLKRTQGYKAQTTRTVVIQRASNKLAVRTYMYVADVICVKTAKIQN